jgi:hypothetical protein
MEIVYAITHLIMLACVVTVIYISTSGYDASVVEPPIPQFNRYYHQTIKLVAVIITTASSVVVKHTATMYQIVFNINLK